MHNSIVAMMAHAGDVEYYAGVTFARYAQEGYRMLYGVLSRCNSGWSKTSERDAGFAGKAGEESSGTGGVPISAALPRAWAAHPVAATITSIGDRPATRRSFASVNGKPSSKSIRYRLWSIPPAAWMTATLPRARPRRPAAHAARRRS